MAKIFNSIYYANGTWRKQPTMVIFELCNNFSLSWLCKNQGLNLLPKNVWSWPDIAKYLVKCFFGTGWPHVTSQGNLWTTTASTYNRTCIWFWYVLVSNPTVIAVSLQQLMCLCLPLQKKRTNLFWGWATIAFKTVLPTI